MSLTWAVVYSPLLASLRGEETLELSNDIATYILIKNILNKKFRFHE